MLNVLVWLFLCLIWGSTWIFIKIGLADLPPMTFAAARFLLAVIILLPAIYALKVPLPRTGREWRLIAITGFLQFSVNYSSVFWAEQYITSGLAAVLQAMISVFGLLLAWIFLPAERITRQKVLAVALGIVGVAIVFVDQLKIESFMAFAGSLAIVVGSYAAAQASILIKARGGGLHPASLVCMQMICGLPAVVIYALSVEGPPTAFNWSGRALLCIAYLTLLGTVTTFWLYYWLLSRIESTKAMTISLVTPFLAVLVGRVVLGEEMPPWTLAGGSMIVVGVGLIALGRSSAPSAVAPETEG